MCAAGTPSIVTTRKYNIIIYACCTTYAVIKCKKKKKITKPRERAVYS